MKKFNCVTPDMEQDKWNSLVTLWAVLGLTAGHMGPLIHGVWIYAWPQVQTISCQSADIIYAYLSMTQKGKIRSSILSNQHFIVPKCPPRILLM